MSHLVTEAFIALFKEYPLYSQENNSDPLVVAKLFNAYGATTWYVTEFNPDTKIAFGFVVGLGEDEWGYTSLTELESVKHPVLKVPVIERDVYFTQAPISQFIKR